MTSPLKALALAASLALAAGAADAAPISYAYKLQPGELDFTVDSTALNAQGFGTAAPAQGLLSLTLSIAGQTFQTAADAFYPSQPYVTLVNSALSFAVFAPTSGTGVSYNFYASGSAVPNSFDYTFTGSNGTSISGTGVAAAAVPEPATLSLLAAGMFGVLLLRRRA